MSLALAGSCLGQFFLIPVFSDMIVVSGWRSTTLWIAALSLVVNLALTFGVIRGDPDRFGLRPTEAASERARRPRTVAVPGAPLVPPAAGTSLSPRPCAPARCGSSPSPCSCAGAADYFVTTHLVPMVTDYGLSPATGAGMLAWLGLVSLGGVLLSGPASDAIGNKIPIAITFGLRIVLFVMLLQFKGAAPFWVFSLGMGFTLLVTAVLTPTLVGALYGVTHIGFISGFITTVHMVGGGAWSYLGGVVFDSSGDYDLALVISAVASAVALGCTLFIRERRHLPPA